LGLFHSSKYVYSTKTPGGNPIWQYEPLKTVSRNHGCIFSDNPETRYELDSDYAYAQNRVFDETKARKEREAKRVAEHKAEMEQTKKAFAEMYGKKTIMDVANCNFAAFPNANFFQLPIPVHPRYFDSKRGWELILVRVWQEKAHDWLTGEDKDALHYAYTNSNGNSSSFSSVSYKTAKDVEEALWESVNSCYHNGFIYLLPE
jgi:hypothetical protein